MSVANRVNIRPHAIKQEMHGQLGGRFSVPRDMPPFGIDGDQIVWREHPLVHARGSSEYPLFVETHREIAFACHDVLALIHPPPRDAKVQTVLVLALGGTR
jgi:hypothetical protein